MPAGEKLLGSSKLPDQPAGPDQAAPDLPSQLDGHARMYSRKETARLFREVLGLPMTEGTLATSAVRGRGPPFHHWGSRVVYDWSECLEWARAKLTPAAKSTSHTSVMITKGR